MDRKLDREGDLIDTLEAEDVKWMGLKFSRGFYSPAPINSIPGASICSCIVCFVCMSLVFSWIADGSKQQFTVRRSSTSLHDVLIEALTLRNIAADSGLSFHSSSSLILLFLTLEFFDTVGWS